ncbi:MAG: hypothetical protein IJ400_00610 [Clostridia bacterium]|nr:hypothetical protein [Clostridia bacterium]
MKVYIRKIDKQSIEKQMSYTKEILREFLGDLADHGKIICEGKTTKEKVTVTLLLATDPRFDNNIQKLLKMEGDLAIGDLMVMYKVGSKYIVELIKPTDARHASYLELFGSDRHVLLEGDTVGIDAEDEFSDVLNHNLYGIHIKMQNDALSEDTPHICIGWSAMGDLSSVGNREELGVKYDATWPNTNTRKKGQDVGQVWRFIREMQVGDYVVFADGEVCHIGRVTSDYYFDNNNYENQSVDYANTRKVEWLKKDILRSDLSETFHHSLMTAMSVWGLNDYKSVVYDLLNGTYEKDEIVLEDEAPVIDETEIFAGFTPWLTSYNNPDYTGREKYAGYPRALERLVEFMENKGLIADANLNDSNVEKYEGILDTYNSSDEAKEFDEKNLASKAGSAALKKYIKYIEYLNLPKTKIEIDTFDYSTTKGTSINKIFFGTPGCGKSYHIEHDILGKDNDTKEYVGAYSKERVIRTTFYQDYSNTDFVGQILPKVVKGKNGEKDTVEYIFNPGPFTLALIQAISNPTKKVALVIEEINRGNAPAIFGDIFQLLDRDGNSISEYGIVNVSMMDYLNAYEFVVDEEKKRYTFSEIKIPGNMDIFATMNTSDQNVYTLDTAFVRRWDKVKIKNSFENCKFKDMPVPGMSQYTWEEFVTSINNCIAKHLEDLQVNEDKQIGAFFVKESLLSNNDAEKFAYKVFDYLWSDVAKLDHGIFFNTYDTLESLIEAYKKNGVGVFKTGIFEPRVAASAEEEENNE